MDNEGGLDKSDGLKKDGRAKSARYRGIEFVLAFSVPLIILFVSFKNFLESFSRKRCV